MAKRITPEGKLIELFDSVDIDRAEILLGVAKTMLKLKKKELHDYTGQVVKQGIAKFGTQ